jgi:hypothetical protein
VLLVLRVLRLLAEARGSRLQRHQLLLLLDGRVHRRNAQLVAAAKAAVERGDGLRRRDHGLRPAGHVGVAQLVLAVREEAHGARAGSAKLAHLGAVALRVQPVLEQLWCVGVRSDGRQK